MDRVSTITITHYVRTSSFLTIEYILKKILENCRGRSELRNILRGSFRESFWECILWSRSWKYVRNVLLWWSILCPLTCYNSCSCCLFEIGIIFIVFNSINVIIIDAIKCDHHCYCNHHHYYQKCSVYILYCYCWLSLY